MLLEPHDRLQAVPVFEILRASCRRCAFYVDAPNVHYRAFDLIATLNRPILSACHKRSENWSSLNRPLFARQVPAVAALQKNQREEDLDA